MAATGLGWTSLYSVQIQTLWLETSRLITDTRETNSFTGNTENIKNKLIFCHSSNFFFKNILSCHQEQQMGLNGLF